MPKTKSGFLLDDSLEGAYSLFTKEQTEKIQSLFDAGKDVEAQKMIDEILKKGEKSELSGPTVIYRDGTREVYKPDS